MTDRELLPLWVEVTNEQGNVFILDPIKESDKIESAKSNGLSITPLYAAPPKKEWVWLTFEEVQEILTDPRFQMKPFIVHAVEAKLKEKNT